MRLPRPVWSMDGRLPSEPGHLRFTPASYGPRNALPTPSPPASLPRVGAGLGPVNVIFALTPELRGRQALLAEFAFAGVALVAHALVLPTGRTKRLLARLAGRVNPQIEKRYGLNTKLALSWQPRSMYHDGSKALPRAALVVTWVDGQLPPLELRRLARLARRARVPASRIEAA